MRRGDVYFADLSPIVGSEQGGVRPVVIIQNDKGNQYAPTVIVAAITAKMTKASLPTHIDIAGCSQGVHRDSVILAEQIRTIDKSRLQRKICSLPSKVMDKVDDALCVSIGIRPAFAAAY